MGFAVGGRRIPAVSLQPPFGAYRSNAQEFTWLNDSVASMVMFTVHELFHGFQEKSFRRLPGEPNAFANTVPVRPYMKLLDSAGVQAQLEAERAQLLLASRAPTPLQLREHFAAYDSLRNLRLSGMPDVMRTYEDAHERIEGVANWVGYEGVRVAITQEADRTTRLIQSDLSARYRETDGSEVRGWNSYALWHLYVVGAAKADLLEQLRFPQWKARLAGGSTLESLLLEAVGIH